LNLQTAKAGKVEQRLSRKMPDTETIKNRINARFESILHATPSGDLKPYVCLFCDEFLKPGDVEVLGFLELQNVQDVLKPSDWNSVPEHIAAYYDYVGDCGDHGNSLDTDIDG